MNGWPARTLDDKNVTTVSVRNLRVKKPRDILTAICKTHTHIDADELAVFSSSWCWYHKMWDFCGKRLSDYPGLVSKNIDGSINSYLFGAYAFTPEWIERIES